MASRACSSSKDLTHRDGRGLPGIVGVLLEGKAKHRQALARNGIKERSDDAGDEAALLPVVEPDDMFPVVRDLGDAEKSAEINQIENVLLKTGSTKAHRRLEEFRTDAGVGADRTRDLVDVRAGRFAKSGDRVDRGNALRQKSIGHELGQLRRPEIRRQDALAGNPPRIDGNKLLDGRESFRESVRRQSKCDRELPGRRPPCPRRETRGWKAPGGSASFHLH